MTKILLLIFPIILFCNLLIISDLEAQESATNQDLVQLRTLLEKHHVSPKAIDDTLSEKIFRRFIQLLDHSHLYFTEVDITALKPYRKLLDEELLGKSSDFLKIITPLYQARLQKIETWIKQITAKPFDFEQKNKIYSYKEGYDFSFPEDDKEAQLIWEKLLKYRTLTQLYNKLGDKNNIQKTDILANEANIRQKVSLIETRKIKHILEHPEGFEKYVRTKFMLAVTVCFDPHSAFMTLTETQNFQNQLSTEALSFGIDLSESESGEVEIERLIPGGPAWKSNELHKGDILVKLKWENKESIDLSSADLEEVSDILEQTNAGKLEITVRKTNGTFKTIALRKAKIREDENIVKSFILNTKPKIGYISLPGFYDEWENSGGSGCANDVAREVLKMKKEGIEGIILDLRYNGGGSLREGLDLAGIFINEGPLMVSVTRNEKPTVVKDANRGTVFDGPLVVMTNRQSASASEILAAALQDYNRALIVGTQTFGKSTGQRIFPLNDSEPSSSNLPSTTPKEHNFAKITTLKLYRVTGRTAQLSGVKPDIEMKDLYSFMDYREKMMPYALSSDSVNKKVYYTPLVPLPVKELAEKHQARVQNNEAFKQVNILREELDAIYKKSRQEIPLDWQSYITWYKQNLGKLTSMATTYETKPTDLQIDNLTADKTVLAVDTYSKEINNLLLENLKEDIYLAETYQIIKDLISLTKK